MYACTRSASCPPATDITLSTGHVPRNSTAQVIEQERRLSQRLDEVARLCESGMPCPMFVFLDSSFRGGVGPAQPGKRGVEGLAGPLLGQADLLADLLERR